MKFIDLNKQYQQIKSVVDAGIQAVLDHGQFIQGPEISQLEQHLARYVGVKHCIAMSSGTTALQVALMALGVGPGDEVITSSFGFFATAEVVMLLGAKPVFVDIDPQTYNLNPALIESAITDKTKVILPVSLYGQCADMDAINQIAQHNIPVIEDAAQSFGARYKGKRSCGLSEIGCTSFFPSKPLGAYGDAGACFTDDDQIADKIRRVINHGQDGRYNHIELGINGRMATLQAPVLLAKMSIFDNELEQRQQVAKWYADAFAEEDLVHLPIIESHNYSAIAQYTIAVQDRDHLQQQLKERGIPTAVHYPKGLHQQPFFLQACPRDWHLPNTEQAASQVLSLPFHPYIQQSEVEHVAEVMLEIFSQYSRVS